MMTLKIRLGLFSPFVGLCPALPAFSGRYFLRGLELKTMQLISPIVGRATIACHLWS
jgi:hypothetical protein